MERLELITSEQQFHDRLAEILSDSRSFSICSPAVDSAWGKWKTWKLLEAHLPKLEHAYIGLDGMRSEPYALDVLYRENKLRLVPAADGSFRVHLWRFKAADAAHVLVGAGMLCPPGLLAPADAIAYWSGPEHSPFGLQIERLLENVASMAHIPSVEELNDYAKSQDQGLEYWDELCQLGAPYIQHTASDTAFPILDLVSTPTEVASAVRQLQVAFESASSGGLRQRIGFPGGSVNASIYWVPSLSVWAMFDELDNRYWNAFGIERPDAIRTISAAVEINMPRLGMNKRIAGAIARNPLTDEQFVVHRGRIGGGGKGIGSELFWRRFRGGVSVSDGQSSFRAAVVTLLGSPTIVRDIAAFVHQVARIKDAAR